MSKIPEVFAIFEQKLAHVLSFTVVPLKSKDLKNALEEILTYFSGIVERASKAESHIAELEEQVWNLNLENERLEEAYWIDETISPDGTLKPSVRKLLERLEKAETDLRLSDDLVKALDNRIAKLEAENDQLTARWRQERQDDKWIPVSEQLTDEEVPF